MVPVLWRLFQHVVTMPAGYGHECDSLRVVTDLLDEVGGFFHDFVESVFTPLQIGVTM
jgi:hypothetical protein